MKFLGKFSFYFQDRVLTYFGSRAGLHRFDDKVILDDDGNKHPLTDEATRFLAYEYDATTFVLMSHSGGILSFGGDKTLSEVSTVACNPPGQPKFPHMYFSPLRFDLAPIREARAKGTWSAMLHFTAKPRFADDMKGYIGPSNLTTDIKRNYDEMRNVIQTNIEPTHRGQDWQIKQYADGIDEIQSAKKVRLFDFSPVGKAIVDMSGQELREIDLGASDFRGANFSNATLQKCITDGARFEKANFNGAKIIGGYYHSTEFSDVTMQGTTLDNVSGKGCNFTRVDLSTAKKPAGSPIGMLMLSDKNYRTRYTGAKISIELTGRDWSWTMFDDAEIDGIEQIPENMNFRANNANLSRVNLSKLNCKYADFSNAEMYGTVLSSAKIPGAKFLGAKLDEAVLSAADLQAAKFQNAQLSGTSFSGARLHQAVFDGATLVDVDFSNAYLEAVSFTGIEQKQMSGALFNRAFLVNSDLTGIDLATQKGARRSSLVEAYLHGANLSGAQLAGTNLTSAGIATEPGELTVRLPDLPLLTISYDATAYDPSSTNPESICPSGQKGPCDGDKLKPKIPFPDVWPWPRGKES